MTKRNSWIRRMVAAGMAACMVLTTPLSVLAENTVTESTEESLESIEIGETESQQESTSFAEDETQQDLTETAETEEQTETIEEETQEIQLSLELLAEGTDDASQTLGLSLTEAAELSTKLEATKLAVDEKTKTINVTDGAGLILLSNVKPEDYCSGYTINLITTAGWDVTQSVTIEGMTYKFLGLGDADTPYEGAFTLDAKTSAQQYSITTSRALFNVLSTKAELKDTIPFILSNSSSSEKPLLAEKLKSDQDATPLQCKVVLRDVNAAQVSDAKIGGLIGTIESGASANITFENYFSRALTVTGESHTGLFCGTMESNSSLTATFTSGSGAGQISVAATANNADAGGFVGYMTGANLTVDGSSVAEVTSKYGNAGGIVGSVENGSIQIASSGSFTAESLTLSAGSGKAAGGLIGAYTITEESNCNYDLSNYKLKDITISGGENVGGLFGVLESKIGNTNKSFVSISGKTENGSPIKVTVSGEVTNFGGLIGSYMAADMASALLIKGDSAQSSIDITSEGGSYSSTSYGGVIGTISNNSYVEIENVASSTADMKNSATASFGGLVGKMENGLLNVGSVTLATETGYDLATNNDNTNADVVDGRGGLVGHLVKGVLRLQGTTDLSKQKITIAYNHVGQIVGNNDNGLVYALGSGNGLADNGTGWELVRCSDDSRSGSDIGNWGAVVRLGDNLTESTEGNKGAFTFDENAHTVTVNNGADGNISSTNDFVAYALAFDISKAYTDEDSALQFRNQVNPESEQNVTLTADVDLTDTGIIGIGKDIEGERQNFTGTIDGRDNKITLDIGTTYGKGISAGENAAGQLYAKRSDQRDAHYSLALIPFSVNATIQNVTINGNVNCKIPAKVTQAAEEDDTRYPAFASGVIGLASGETTFENVNVDAAISVTEEEGANKLHVWQSGFLGRCDDNISLTFEKCTWGNEASLTDQRSTDNARLGGMAAEVMGGCTVTVKDSVISGLITESADKNAWVGGLIAVSRGETQNGTNNTFTSNSSKITISNLQVENEKITATASKTSGGLLGYLWQNTDVTFDSETDSNADGVTVSGSKLTAGNAQFGGLVYRATGYWKATAANSIVFAMGENSEQNSFTGKSTQDAPSGLLIGQGFFTKNVRVEDKDVETVPYALYLEVGTYGSDANAAYKIADNAVTLNLNGSEYFDELVGITKYDDARDRNAIVSIAVRNASGTAIKFDKTENNTYTYQTGKHYKNSKTRYYYNLDAYRKNTGVNFDAVTSAESLVLWGVSQYAANTLKHYFWSNANSTGPKTEDKQTDVTISGKIDLTGYSYYPVTPLGNVTLGNGSETTLTFDNETIETVEENNKKPSDSEHQHYLMHHGLLYNTNYSVDVNNVVFSGTVGKEAVSGENIAKNTYNSGALIFGTASGDPTKTPIEIKLNNVTLAGIKVIDIEKDSIAYAPLMINKIDRALKLTVDTLSTGEGYTTGEGESKTTVYAATSLIGNVGSKDATKLTLSFSNIALDGREENGETLSETVHNNGENEVNYHTTHTIFTRATLLEKFQYVPAEGSGVYNFNSTDTMVTYGVELTNTTNTEGLTGRNPDKQYKYYDGGYIRDEADAEQTEAYVKGRYTASNFIRYVHTQENSDESLFELDINQRATGLLEGCGTYGDPYIIKDGEQLISLAAYIKDSTTVNDFQVVFNSKVFEDEKQTSESYHNKDGATSEATGSDATYKWENGKWLDSADVEEDETFTKTATNYLLNAYYEISNEITIKSDSVYAGLGTIEKPFSGVIVGQNQNRVKISCTGSRLGFGGLIAYSRGSVVKDLTLDYSGTRITMSSSEYPGSKDNYPFFGGVVGYCMGGDTIIDQVSVEYTSPETIEFNGTKDNNDMTCLIPAGGYIGLVGGASSTKYTDGYEKDGGGVIFRNMENSNNTFASVCSGAGAANKTVDNDGKTTGDGQYFYRNPYVGRVLDGYVCSEEVPLENTDKNYTIPTLHADENGLVVSKDTDSLNVTVNSAQGLWLLSAIVNSGAGAMSSDGTYADVDKKTVDAYQTGKPRTGTYENIGKEAGENIDTYLADEKYWGGIASTSGSDDAKNRVSYLVKNYTVDTNAAYLAGKSDSATNTPVALRFSKDIDVSSYGNGFRGIGSSYGNNMGGWQIDYSIPKVYRRNLLIKSINAGSTTDTTITLNMNQSDYYDEYKNGSWRNQGAGLFVAFHFTNGATVNHLKISGNVKAGIFKSDGTLTYLDKYTYDYEVNGKKDIREEDVGVGGFAARTANSWGKVTFSNFHLDELSVYGGTSTGGAIGYTDFPGGSTNTGKDMISFETWSINKVKVLESVYNNGSAGGLIGWFESGRTLKIIGYGDSDKQNITDLYVKTIAQSVNVATAGGLVGAIDFGSINVEGVNGTEVNVSGEKLRDAGGLIAGGRQAGEIIIKNCVLASISVVNSKDDRYGQGGVGGVLGFHGDSKTATISGVEIKGNSSISGVRSVGGFVGRSAQNITIENCKESELSIYADWNDAGGFIGILNYSNTVTIKNGIACNLKILAKENVGGLIGNINNGALNIANIELSGSRFVTKKSGNCAGGLVGYASNKTVKGYNILASDCKVGYNDKANIDNLSTVKLEQTNICGLWIGESVKDGSVDLVAVSANGDVYPQCDVGSKTEGTVNIVYADKSADQTYQPVDEAAKPSSSANPWVDVNPKSAVLFADNTIMTGNGVGMDANGTVVAKSILEGISTEDADRYWNLKESTVSTDETYRTFSQFLDSTNDAYLTTYKAEESATTTVSSDINFPVLVVNNSAEVDTMLWNYIAAMTNVKNGTTAKGQIKNITATTYKWDSSNKKFAAQTTASLSINTSKKISIVPNAYDNQNSQFTLLDVTYTNPVDAKAEFHLYIPVLVKKVLYVWFKTRFLAGTDYRAEDYPMNDKNTEHYATAGFDEPLTAYIEYTYDKDTDWQSMLDNGENLLWSYGKVLDLAFKSTAEAGQTLLPKGTQLTLLDRQTKQYYTYTTDGKEDVHNFNLAQMQTPDDQTKFKPVDICDLLGLTVSDPVTDAKDGVTYYIEVSDSSQATVKVGGKYYRKATESDTEAKKYSITVTENSAARSEGYYLTIQIPSTAGVSIVNNRLNYASLSRETGTLPASIKTETAPNSSTSISSSAYPVYQGVDQTFEISTSRIHNGKDMGGDTVMENGDSIKIRLESKLQLTEEGKDQFSKLGPAEVYHQFDISLKKYLDTNGKYDVIGTENVTYTYTLSGNGWNKEINGTIQNAAGQETITIRDGGRELKTALEKATSDKTAITVTAEFILTYAGADHFPVRNTDTDNSGISAIAVSRIANTESQLPITENKIPKEDGNRYYITNPSKADLTYSTVSRTDERNVTQQLGINPWDTANNRSDVIDTRADYDYSGVDAAILEKASKIRYRMELFQKNEKGTYDESVPLSIGEYLQGTSKAGSAPTSLNGTVYQWEDDFTSNNTKHQFADFSFSPLTGDEFEKQGYTYANYRVRLTVVLLDKDGNELNYTKTSDYIIYTNARIYQEILGADENTASDSEE